MSFEVFVSNRRIRILVSIFLTANLNTRLTISMRVLNFGRYLHKAISTEKTGREILLALVLG